MRLIDADALLDKMQDYGEGQERLMLIDPYWVRKAPTIERPHGECKTCKHYIPYREQFSDRNRGDGYCKSAITTSEGQAYINCHDEWYCANYEKEGEKNESQKRTEKPEDA